MECQIGKIPNILLSDKYGIVVDELNYELVILKTRIITENNIKSLQSQYEEGTCPYQIGDTVYEWTSCNKYGSSLQSILDTYIEIERRNLIMEHKLQPFEDIIVLEVDLCKRIRSALPAITNELRNDMNSIHSLAKQASELFEDFKQTLEKNKKKLKERSK